MKHPVSVAVALAVMIGVAWAGPAPDQQKRIDGLIKQLGDADGTVRKEASRKLEETGGPALDALKGAMKSDDPEVRVRATGIYEKLVHPTPQQLQALRDAVQEHFSRADYAGMVGPAGRLLIAETSEDEDCMWLGHACQLSERWKEAVDAYLVVLRRIDAELKAGPKPVPAPPPPRGFDGAKEGGGGVRVGVGLRQVGPRQVPPDPNWRPKLIAKRTFLALWVARLQRVELKDSKAAIKTLTGALVHADLDKGKVQAIWYDILKELAIAREEAGDLRAALATWEKLHRACLENQYGTRTNGFVDVGRVERLLAQLDPKDPPPDLSFVYLLTPEHPEARLQPDNQETQRRAWNVNARYVFAFVPPADKEFATLECACDIEQWKRFAGQLYCDVAVPGVAPRKLRLGSIGWPHDKPFGREVRRATFEIPPGVRAVHVETASVREAFTIHSVNVKATFRPVTRDPGPLEPGVRAWMQTEFIPGDGKGSCGDMGLASQRAYTDVKPGTYRLRYAVPGRDGAFDQDFVIEPGRRYGVFVNLDSPFKWSQAGPEKIADYPVGGLSLAPLPNGGWISAWGSSQWGWSAMRSWIMLCTTKDLEAWDKPVAAPFNSVFQNMSPALHAAKDGTVWLAYFSSRLSLLDRDHPRFRLWLTSTRDGKTWTPPRPVAVREPVCSMPTSPPQMLEGPDGKCRLFWLDRAGSAASFDEIREITPVALPGVPDGDRPKDGSVALDSRGVFHMTFSTYSHGFGYATSKDGAAWSAAVFPPGMPDKYDIGRPQLILRDGRMLLLYERQGGWLLPMRPDGVPVDPKKALKITGHVVPLLGSRPHVTKDGEVLLLVGDDTSWMLRAKLSDLLKLCDKE